MSAESQHTGVTADILRAQIVLLQSIQRDNRKRRSRKGTAYNNAYNDGVNDVNGRLHKLQTQLEKQLAALAG